MFKKIKESLVIAASVLLFAVPVLAPVSVHAAPTPPVCDSNGQPAGACTPPPPSVTDNTTPNVQDSLCSGAELSTNQTTCASTKAINPDGTNKLIGNIINIFSLVVGIVAVLMIIIGGFRYITSGGNDGNVGNAKNTILYAVIGLVIVALAQIIVRFVLNRAISGTTGA